MAEKVYCGSGKEKSFPDGGSIIELTIPIEELVQHAEVYGFTASTSGRRMIRIKVSPRRQIGAYGETHTVEVDTWKPTPGAGGPRAGGYGSAPAGQSRYAARPPAQAGTSQGPAAPPQPSSRGTPPASQSGEWPARAPTSPPPRDFDDDFPDDGF